MANEFKIKKGLIVNGSGSIVLDIQGSQGQLFSVTDQLTGTLFSVSDISGIPILEVDSDDTIRMGTFGSEAIIVSGSQATISGSFSGSFQGDGQSQWDDVTGGINYASGNVGIGTTTPNHKLSVAGGNIEVNNGGATWFGSDATGGFARTFNGNSFRFISSANSETMRINNATGNVGIGTTSPTNKLEVISATNEEGIAIKDSSGNLKYKIRQFGGNSYSTFWDSSNTEKVKITSGGSSFFNGGNVGIGTTSPSQKLDVEGNVIIRPLNTTDTISFLNLGSNQSRLVTTNNFAIFNGSIETARFLTTGGFKLAEYGSGTFTGTATQRLGVDTSGNVIEIPIGSGAVDGSGTTNFVTKWIDGDTVGDSVIFDNGTNVGIGTTSPGEKLDVNGRIRGDRFRTNVSGEATFAAYYFLGDADTGTFQPSNNTFAITTAGTERMRIDGAGNVGIGTTSPSQKLDVAGSIRTNNQLTVFNTDLSKQILKVNTEATTNTGILKLSNGSNWGLLIRGESNTPLIGSYFGGGFNITGFEDTTGTTTSAIKLAQFVFGGTGGGSGYLTLNGDLKVNNNKKIKFGYGNSQENGIEWIAGSKISAAITPVDTANFSRAGLGFFTGDFSDGTTNADERMRITREGNVGIGTTTPSAKLEVSGDLRISSSTTDLMKISNESGEDYFAVSQSTNNKPTLSLGDIDEQYGTLLTVNVESEEVLIFTNGTVTIGDNGFGNTTQFIVDDVNEKFTFTNGNVGIGTTSPSQKLTVEGNIELGTGGYIYGDTTTPSLRLSNAVGAVLSYGTSQLQNGGSLQFVTTAGTKFRINANGGGYVVGNFGIDTTIPSEKLEVSGNIKLSSIGTGNSASSYGMLFYGTTSSGTQTDQAKIHSSPWATNSNGGNLQLYTSNASNALTERMRIDGAGNVGIGTTSPSAPLTFGKSVYGDFDSENFYRIKLQDQGGILNDVGIGQTATGNLGFNITAGKDFLFNGGTSGNALTLGSSGNATFAGTISVQGTGDSYFTGNVGIGTTAPSAGLQVAKGGSTIPAAGSSTASAVFGNSTSDDNYGLAIGANSSGVGYISSQRTDGTATTYNLAIQPNGGNVGIGTTSPNKKLHVNSGAINEAARFESTDVGAFIEFKDNSTTDLPIIGGVGNNFDIRTGGSTSIRVTSAGNVGIGTTNPSYKLQVAGGILAGGKVTYSKTAGSLDTTGYAVAGLIAGSNGNSCMFTFTAIGNTGHYQKVVYSCWNAAGTWNTSKVIDEGTNGLDIEASTNGTTVTFTFKSRSGSLNYSPRVVVEASGHSINNTYA